MEIFFIGFSFSAHMDLKPKNILLSSSREPFLKIAGALFFLLLSLQSTIRSSFPHFSRFFPPDFGFAQYLKSNDGATDMRGSPLYMAPEMFLSRVYDARVDLWSVGVILYGTKTRDSGRICFEEKKGKERKVSRSCRKIRPEASSNIPQLFFFFFSSFFSLQSAFSVVLRTPHGQSRSSSRKSPTARRSSTRPTWKYPSPVGICCSSCWRKIPINGYRTSSFSTIPGSILNISPRKSTINWPYVNNRRFLNFPWWYFSFSFEDETLSDSGWSRQEQRVRSGRQNLPRWIGISRAGTYM